MSSDEIVALREQIDILEDRQARESVTRRATLNVLKRHDLMGEYAEELSKLAELGDTSAIHYSQERPINISFHEEGIGDCSSARKRTSVHHNDELIGFLEWVPIPGGYRGDFIPLKESDNF